MPRPQTSAMIRQRRAVKVSPKYCTQIEALQSVLTGLCRTGARHARWRCCDAGTPRRWARAQFAASTDRTYCRMMACCPYRWAHVTAPTGGIVGIQARQHGRTRLGSKPAQEDS